MSTLVVNSLENTSGLEHFTAKAWVDFNGTGTVAIRESGNVSSITDISTGCYHVNFATALPDANYAVSLNCGNPGTYISQGSYGVTSGGTEVAPTTTGVRVVTLSFGGGIVDTKYTSVVIF